MSTYETRSRAGSDGKVILVVPPEFANTDIRITVEPLNAGASTAGSNGAPQTLPPRPELTPEAWHSLIDRMTGAMPDFPDIERPGPDDYESREWP